MPLKNFQNRFIENEFALSIWSYMLKVYGQNNGWESELN
jgi:hypothetical protein